MRIGIDLGGSKIEILAIDREGRELTRRRVPTPRDDYHDVIRTMRDLVLEAEGQLGRRGSVGVAIPGTISPFTGLVKNANATRLNGHPLDKDLAAALTRAVRVANDANCFVLSEATDGAAVGKDVVFGIIAGTGVGGGVCVGGRVLTGAHAIAGEWGHNSLPRPSLDEVRDAPHCYCGRRGCIEAWCSGPALAAQYAAGAGRHADASEIARLAGQGDRVAAPLFEAFIDRFARAIAGVVNILDPDAIVLGGGLSNIDALYRELPKRVENHAFSAQAPSLIVRNRHGDSSGVRGAAWLWPKDRDP
ncbi:MAG: ROK family protein [Alphaproteobacteria bacterium]|nr:ROK family protein [Alphaproteobacteria bacterium]